MVGTRRFRTAEGFLLPVNAPRAILSIFNLPSSILHSWLMHSKISIVDLEVFYRVGVPDTERALAQRLLLTIEMEFDFSAAARSNEIMDTIDYHAVSQRFLKFGEGRSWKLIEKLATDIANTILIEFKPAAVTVEVKKFIIREARHVSVTLTKRRG